ncbi:STAS domain-containing protein [Quadrisphaera sp. DSM 44207]|uniref:STAS domain-containing protein n=1 Tax=Quadrisphaera sp. DSM 44207 TaxID=1881057 RepID=UPI001C40A135
MDAARLRPDLAAVDALARAQLAARRRGRRVVLRSPSPQLRELLDLAGLCGVLPEEASGRGGVLEVVREPEEGEQAGGVEEVRHPGDAPV